MGTKLRCSFLTTTTNREMRCARRFLPGVKKWMGSKNHELFLALTLHRVGGMGKGRQCENVSKTELM